MCKHWAAKAEKCLAALVVSVKKLTEKFIIAFGAIFSIFCVI
jgi:hypothetical protein